MMNNKISKPSSIGKDWSFEYDFKRDEIEFEYYLRRGKKLFFRNGKKKLVIEIDDFFEWFMSTDPQYGDEYNLDLIPDSEK
jgi:hypothetical protein